MGLLDMFDNPAVLQSLFGIGGDAGASPQMPMPPGGGVPNQPQMVQAPMPPPRPPEPQLGAASMDEAGMQGAPQGVPLPPPAPNANFDQRFAAANPPLPQGGPSIPPSGGVGSDAARTPRVPVPTWAPGTEANAQAPLPPQPSGPPMPPPPPGGPVPPGGAQPAMPAPNGGLPGAFGVNQQPSRADALRAALGGLGKGLSNVGKLPAGASKGQSFAAGLGGSLEGTTEAQQKQKDTLFNQSSAYFKDYLAAKNSDNAGAYKEAQSNWLAARAEALRKMTEAGGNGSRAMLNTPDGKVAYAESQALKMRDQLRKSAEAKAKATGTEVDEEGIDKKVEEYRDRLYKQFKMDPKEAEKIKDRGLTPENPFDTKGMNSDQFHTLVPMGGWYKDQNGKVRQRTVPPPGSRSEAPAEPTPQSSAADAETDRIAMTDAA